jgi:hypothetical protein
MHLHQEVLPCNLKGTKRAICPWTETMRQSKSFLIVIFISGNSETAMEGCLRLPPSKGDMMQGHWMPGSRNLGGHYKCYLLHRCSNHPGKLHKDDILQSIYMNKIHLRTQTVWKIFAISKLYPWVKPVWFSFSGGKLSWEFMLQDSWISEKKSLNMMSPITFEI